MEALIGQGNVDPVTVREVSPELWIVMPFYCPQCRLNYCSQDWDIRLVVHEGCFDCVLGTCPKGHQHLLG